MVMASASMPARRRMGACETTPPATPGDNHATLRKPARKDPFLASDDPSPLSGVQLVRPRRCAAPGAPAGPRPHGDATRVAARKIPKIVRPSPERHHASHRVKPLCPLDTDGPHGCRRRWAVAARWMAMSRAMRATAVAQRRWIWLGAEPGFPGW